MEFSVPLYNYQGLGVKYVSDQRSLSNSIDGEIIIIIISTLPISIT